MFESLLYSIKTRNIALMIKTRAKMIQS